MPANGRPIVKNSSQGNSRAMTKRMEKNLLARTKLSM